MSEKREMMSPSERREAVMALLQEASAPISATALARACHVSRQIIVGDVALLRARGVDILSTPRGYLAPQPQHGLLYTLACQHSAADLPQELYIMVDNGCTVLNVSVEHPVYGILSGQLQLSSRHDIQEFLDRLATEQAKPLSLLTDGIHLHTLLCPNQEAFARVRQQLSQAGFLVEE